MRVAVFYAKMGDIHCHVPVRITDPLAWSARQELWGSNLVEITHPVWRILYDEADVVEQSEFPQQVFRPW